MNKLIVLLFFVSFHLFSQDTLRFRSGEIKLAKVTEVGTTEIKYYDFHNLTGPIHIISKNDIKLIKYSGGVVDTFAMVHQQINEAKSNNSGLQPISNYKNYISMDQLNSYPYPQTRSRLLKMNYQAKTYTRDSHLALALGYGLGFPIPVITTLYTFGLIGNSNGSQQYQYQTGIFVGGVIVGAIFRIAGNVYYRMNKNKAAHTRRDMVELYNKMQ